MINRREFLGRTGSTLVAGSLAGLVAQQTARAAEENSAAPQTAFHSRFDHSGERIWLGPEYWANPMEDWRIHRGRLECLSGGGDRNVHLLTHQLGPQRGGFAISVRASRIEKGNTDSVGLRIGVRDEINDYRGNCLFGKGIEAGLIDGVLRLGQGHSQELDAPPPMDDLLIELRGEPADAAGRRYTLRLTLAEGSTGRPLGSIKADGIPADELVGNIALVNGFAARIRRGSRFAFAHWQASGDKIQHHPERAFGPILWAMYALSDARSNAGYVLKLTAQLPPIGAGDSQVVSLQFQRDGRWRTIATADIDPDARTAAFRIEQWDATTSTPYRLVYAFDGRDHFWTGTIRQEPRDRPLVLGALTCQHHDGFPYAPVAERLKSLDPDLLFFSGDQIYEANGGYGIIRRPADRAVLNYLRKFYLFGWAFGDVMRDRPTLCLPDDHDVFQGNIWGEGGAAMAKQEVSSRGGYIEPPAMVRVVHLTNCSHHPDPLAPADATPIKQGISVLYTDLVFGRVSFAILADRQFKSGPERVRSGPGRADHIVDPNFDVKQLDQPGLELLGRRQEDFLDRWVADWRGADLKVVLSQTPFTCVSTHGGKDGYIHADLDSGAWPQSPRNRAVRLMRKAFALHVNGDQHIPTLVQYGVDAQRDSNWSFCPPAISVGYQRWWIPDDLPNPRPHQNRPPHDLPNTGEYVDGFGHPVYVYAVGNPTGSQHPDRYRQAHIKASGFGIVRIDPQARTYTCESYRFLSGRGDAGGDGGEQFPGWPLTIRQAENFGRQRTGTLPRITAPPGVFNPVLQVINERDGQLVYALRIQGDHFEPFVFEDGSYTVRIGDAEGDRWVVHRAQRPENHPSRTC